MPNMEITLVFHYQGSTFRGMQSEGHPTKHPELLFRERRTDLPRSRALYRIQGSLTAVSTSLDQRHIMQLFTFLTKGGKKKTTFPIQISISSVPNLKGLKQGQQYF